MEKTMTSSPILITGGTGTLGRQVTPLLLAAGHRLRILTRSGRTAGDGIDYVTGDLVKNEGVEAAVAGVHTIVHLAGGQKGDDEATRNLVRAATRAGVQYLVYISVIGADKVPLAWLRTKLDSERAIAESGIPWTILRAAQFHELTLKAVQAMARLPIVPVPGGLRMQPVDSRDVAARIAELTLGQPAGRVADLAGPAVYGMGDLIRSYLQATGKRRPFMPIRMPGKAGRSYRAGENLALSGADLGKRTWDDFLAEHVTPAH